MNGTFGSRARRCFPRLTKAIQAAAGLRETDVLCALIEYQVLCIAAASETMEPVLWQIAGPLKTIRLAIDRLFPAAAPSER